MLIINIGGLMKKIIIFLVFILAISSAYAQYSGGDGSQSNPYQIANVVDLLTFSDSVNQGNLYSNKYFLMTDDIDLAIVNTVLNTIGKMAMPFRGHFDGGGHSIFNLAVYNPFIDGSSKQTSTGLFACVAKTASVRNLRIASGGIIVSYKKSLCNVGGIAGINYGTITNCFNNATIMNHCAASIYSYPDGIIASATGGIVGINYGTIAYCCNNGSIESINDEGKSIGGIAGEDSAGTIINCYNSGKISGYVMAGIGGIVGSSYNNKLSHCVNTGNILTNSTFSACIGGIVGCANNECRISDCYNTGNIDIMKSCSYVAAGGIIGDFTDNKNITLSNCYNTGNIKVHVDMEIYATNNLGGIAGGLSLRDKIFNITIENCYNAGKVVGSANSAGVGGIMGSISGGHTQGNLYIKNCYNINKVTGLYAGGIMGVIMPNAQYEVSMSNCYYLTATAASGAGYGSSAGTTEKTSTQMRDAAFVTTLNNGQIPTVWSQDTTPYRNNGYPVLPQLENGEITIIASATIGGSISPSGTLIPPCIDNPTTFNMVADPCYHIADVLVDGVSVGVVDSYTFNGGAKDRTIHVIFAHGKDTAIYASAKTYRGKNPTKAGHIYKIGDKPKVRMKLHSDAHSVVLPNATEVKISFDYCNALVWLQLKTLKLVDTTGWTIVDTSLTEDFATLTSHFSITLHNTNGLNFKDSMNLFDIEFLLIFPMAEIVPKILPEYYTVNIMPVIEINSIECIWLDTSKTAEIEIEPPCSPDLRYITISDTPFSLGIADNIVSYSLGFDCDNACLAIYNVLGEAVMLPVPVAAKKGQYELNLNNLGISTGIYLCELRVNGVYRKIANFAYIK